MLLFKDAQGTQFSASCLPLYRRSVSQCYMLFISFYFNCLHVIDNALISALKQQPLVEGGGLVLLLSSKRVSVVIIFLKSIFSHICDI